jgi:predicted metal-binding membrane protein
MTGYFAVWAATAIPAYAVARGSDALAARSATLAEAGPYVGGAVLIAAGLYQFSTYKDVCLSECRSPLGFVMSSWKDGYRGALRMGVEHGWYCLGCCWALFAIFFAVGVMNVAWMGALALLVFAEKVTPAGVVAGRAAAALLVVGGTLLMIDPWLVPGL